MANISKTELNHQQRLSHELERLKKVLKRGHDLKVKWIPDGNRNLSGEVKGEYIFIYDQDIEVALETLKHEFVDYVGVKSLSLICR